MPKILKSEDIAEQKTAIVKDISAQAGRVPPQAVQLEQAVLGSMMLEQDLFLELQGILKAESFYVEAHQKIYAAMQDLSTKQSPIDLYTVTENLKARNQLEEIGGEAYLVDLTQKVASGAHAEYHARIIAQRFIQRELIRISSKIQKNAFNETIDVNDMLNEAQQDIFEISEGNISREPQRVNILLHEAMDEIEKAKDNKDNLSGVPSGFVNIDRITNGWQRADLIIIAARPSMGKTAFVLTMARNIAVEHNRAVAFFSLEMDSIQLIKRLIVAESGIASEKIRGGNLDEKDWNHLEKSITALADAPLYIDDTPAMSIYEFRAKARKLKASRNVELIIIDYLQLMTGPPEMKKMREQEVAAISRALKAIAKELKIPIIALSQLNRSLESRTGNKRPQLSDLRESGAIEQDADLVLFIHRPEYYGLTEDESGQSLEGVAEIIIAKHRNGATGIEQLRFVKEEARFCEMNDFNNMEPPAPGFVKMPSKMNVSEPQPYNAQDGISANNNFDSEIEDA